jgi:enamine deaminase RidA (YjgF/YER057c/UK114 family)
LSDIYKKIEELSLEIPKHTSSIGRYNMMTVFGENYLYTSGTGCAKDGKPLVVGHLGKDVSLEDGKKAARQCALNILANAQECIGDLNRISKIIKMTVFIASAGDFHEQSAVADGASELFSALFGIQNQGVRSAIGVSALPNGQSAEIEVLFELQKTGKKESEC